jgi:5-hydroxyisourate hydrolase-like protein (transthyretin family)
VDNPEVYLPVYFPGTTNVGAATTIELKPGTNFAGVNLTVVEARPARIRGQVLNAGQPARGAQVSIFPRDTSAGVTVRSTAVNPDGTFEFRNIAPGAWEIAGTLNSAGPAAMVVGGPLGNAAGLNLANAAVAAGRTPGEPRMAVRTSVDVGSTDIENLSLPLELGFNVPGRVTIDGRTDPSLTTLRLQLQVDPNVPPLVLLPANPDSNGAFSFEGVTSGMYRVVVNGLPRNTFLRSARLGGVDILNGGLRIDGAPRGALEIVLGTTPGTLDATVLDDRRMPVSAVTVVLVPDAQQQKRYDVYRSATTDSSGRIHLDGVVPGDYKVYAWEDVEANAWTDPEYMRGYEGRGTSVRIDESGRASVEVKVIPYRAN